MPLETLDQSGFLFTETAGEWAVLSADFGEGYELAALIGHPEGLRTWAIKIDALPDSTNQGAPALANTLDADTFLLTEDRAHLLTTIGRGHFVLEPIPITRAQYLWRFFRKSKAAGNQPFWIEFDDPDDGRRKQFLACFIDSKISYQVLCAKVYGTGLPLRERRVKGVNSPVPVED